MGDLSFRCTVERRATDTDLLSRVALGHGDAFTTIWRRHSARIHSICLRIMRDQDEAADAFGAVALLAWQKLPVHAPAIGDLEAWLVRLTRNLCIDIHRRRARQAMLFARMDDVDAEALPDRPGIGPEDLASAGEQMRNVSQAIEDLPRWARPAAHLFFIEDMAYESIAERLGISRAYVRKCIEVGRKGLKVHLEAAEGAVSRGRRGATLSLDEGGGDK